MIALMMASMAMQPAPDTATASEIVVMSRKLANWNGKARSTDKGVTCATVKSSGDADIDAIACATVVSCMTQLTPRVVAAQDHSLNRAQRKAAMETINQQLVACTTAEHDRRLAELADRRFQARTAQ